MNEVLLINPETGVEYIDVPPKVAAAYLGISPTFVYEGLRKGCLPIGTAYEGNGGRWSYNIPIGRLKAYAHGADVTLMYKILDLLEVK